MLKKNVLAGPQRVKVNIRAGKEKASPISLKNSIAWDWVVLDSTYDLRSSVRNHRIIESLRLEKTSKITMHNHQLNSTMPAKPYPKVPHLLTF